MQKELKTIVKEKYAEIARSQSSCCSPSCCEPSAETAFSESYKNLDGYVPDADLALGCGIPTEFAQIKEGDTVLDLGSGAGNDVFVARSLTGETGRVIGVDDAGDVHGTLHARDIDLRHQVVGICQFDDPTRYSQTHKIMSSSS